MVSHCQIPDRLPLSNVALTRGGEEFWKYTVPSEAEFNELAPAIATFSGAMRALHKPDSGWQITAGDVVLADIAVQIAYFWFQIVERKLFHLSSSSHDCCFSKYTIKASMSLSDSF